MPRYVPLWPIFILGLLQIRSVTSSNPTLSCSPSTFPYPEIDGLTIKHISAVVVENLTFNGTASGDIPAVNITNLAFCNTTVTYTHIGQNDSISVQTWLPLRKWNGRFQGAGGGGFATGNPDTSHPVPVHQGFAVASTDGSHYGTNPDAWALNSTGQVDFQLLEDFAYLSLHELAVIGKLITTTFYGKAPCHSYWNGCSTGGRQGLMLAQRYPMDFDGIVALAPAINWPTFIVAEYYPQFIMNQLGIYPPDCEFDAITAAAIVACDGLDGVLDGAISAPGLCTFDPHVLVNTSIPCPAKGTNQTITTAAATIALEAWRGPFSSNGTREWFGLSPDAPLTALSGTNCTTTSNTSSTCALGQPFPIAQQWISLFLLENPSANLTTLTRDQYTSLFQLARDKFQSIIGTAKPDLSAFKAAGGKLLTWHGLADPLIFPNGTNTYYSNVLKKDKRAQDFYRYFVAPGTGHCAPGPGAYPQGALESVIRWVERGVAPDTLTAVGSDGLRSLFPWPLVEKNIGGTVGQDAFFVEAENY